MTTTNWDKIAWGKCKYGFLLEAYKQNKELEKAEEEAELWADAAMRNTKDLTEQKEDAKLEETIKTLNKKGELFK